MAEMDRTIAEIENELKLLEEKISEVKRRLPAHSVKPPIMMELLELEDRRDVLLKIITRHKGSREDAPHPRQTPKHDARGC
jgi:hypothetical protein